MTAPRVFRLFLYEEDGRLIDTGLAAAAPEPLIARGGEMAADDGHMYVVGKLLQTIKPPLIIVADAMPH